MSSVPHISIEDGFEPSTPEGSGTSAKLWGQETVSSEQLVQHDPPPPPTDRRPHLVLVIYVCLGQLEGKQLVQHDPSPNRRPHLVLVIDVCVGQLEGEQLVQHDPEGVDVTLERVRVLLLHSDYLRCHPQDAPCRKHRFTGLIGDPSTRGSGDESAGFGPRSAAITDVQCRIETSTLNSRRVEIWKVREAHRLKVDKK